MRFGKMGFERLGGLNINVENMASVNAWKYANRAWFSEGLSIPLGCWVPLGAPADKGSWGTSIPSKSMWCLREPCLEGSCQALLVSAWPAKGGMARWESCTQWRCPNTAFSQASLGPRVPGTNSRATPHSTGWHGAVGHGRLGVKEENKAMHHPVPAVQYPLAARLKAIPCQLSVVSCRNTGQKCCCAPVWWEWEMSSSGASRAGERDPPIFSISSKSG